MIPSNPEAAVGNALFTDGVLDLAAKTAPCIVGIDPSVALMPEWFAERLRGASSPEEKARGLEEYGLMVLEAVHDLVPVVKPQSAFYEMYGSHGIRALENTICRAKELGLFVLLDAKRGDIGSTAAAYAEAYLSDRATMAVDAMTLNAYLGRDSLEPFLAQTAAGARGVFVCVKTSNPGAGDLQDLVVDGEPIFLHISRWLAEAYQGQTVGRYGYTPVGAVVGATYPDDALVLREALPRSLFLVPGFGAQGGDAGRLRAFFDEQGRGALVSASRAVLYPPVSTADRRSTILAMREATTRFVTDVRDAVGPSTG
jgi:orotidine-5'-phosphate decarboxylase